MGHAILKYNILGYTPKDKDTVVIDWIKDVLPLESMSNLIVEPLTRLNFVKSVSNTVGASFDKDYQVQPILLVSFYFGQSYLFLCLT